MKGLKGVDVIQSAKKQGRNELCACGSGKKSKKCCGKPVAKDVTIGDMLKCLYLLLEGASEGIVAIPKGPIPFSRKMLDEVPDDLIKEILIADDPNFLVLTVKKREKSPIIVPINKNLVKGPGRNIFLKS